MDILLQLQQDLTDKLNSESYFATISVVKLRDLVIAQDISKLLPHLTAKGGKLGCGVLINMPEITNAFANAEPPVSDFQLSADVIENPELNFLSGTGTGLTCEEVARQVRYIFNLFALGLDPGGETIMVRDGGAAIVPVPDIQRMFPGCAGYRVLMTLRVTEEQQSRTAKPTLTNATDEITLTNNSEGATIYYTTDGSFPGPGNPASANVYVEPFAATSGATVRYAAYLAGSLGSDVGNFIAP